ncbi:MAG: hypothetical protein HY744_26970 [Deltaproteobacteria bacterium]|nr:hypothetical protein [Deltaproteobacteria bacterium]
MSRPAVTIDTSVWIPFLRERRYETTVGPLIAEARAWVSTVTLLELYAGTASIEDKRDVDAIRAHAASLGRLWHPGEADLCLAGQLLSFHARSAGAIRPKDHGFDLLIAIGAGRTSSVLLTENAAHMQRWAFLLRRRAGLRVRVQAPPPALS